PYDIIRGMFPDKTHDYVINIGEQDIVLVKEVEPTADTEELESLAGAIVETLLTESYPKKVYIGISSVVDSLKDLARAYKEARIALEVGKVFDNERSVVSYENLGIGRLIYQLPTTLCEAFLQEVFKRGSLETLESRDDDTQMKTVHAFFENNLNVSKTAESLYVHRNTLVYRLEKIRKLTGLDLREFDHAVTFKVALMVKKYLSTKPAKF
ncbi:MAG: helix-turn-helix domain-containing protein, partial [Clostridia bacterium]|nr:helix-turn-helix domain-containing protein [Clostridia bacterium]